MNVKRWVGLAFLLALCPLALACGDGSDKDGGNQTPIASETPAAGAAKADIEMIAGKAFDRSVLTVAADREVAITANNTDGLHSFAVFAGEEYQPGLVEPIAEEEDLFGTAVQLAARICAQAEPGQILAPMVVRELAAGKGVLFADLGETALRGFEEPVRLFEVRWRQEG